MKKKLTSTWLKLLGLLLAPALRLTKREREASKTLHKRPPAQSVAPLY